MVPRRSRTGVVGRRARRALAQVALCERLPLPWQGVRGPATVANGSARSNPRSYYEQLPTLRAPRSPLDTRNTPAERPTCGSQPARISV
jgi:hypothetical protein